MMAVMSDIHRLRHDRPSPRALRAARLIVDAPGVPEALRASARLTIEEGEAHG